MSDYEVVTTTRRPTSRAPAFIGIPGLPGFTPLDDHRLTMRDVILRRSSDVDVFDSGTGNYATRNFSVTLGGRAFMFTRGYNWADVGRQARLPLRQHAPGVGALDLRACCRRSELVAGPALDDRPDVLVCDCNSDPANGTIKPNDTVPHWAAVPVHHRAGAATGTSGCWPSRRPRRHVGPVSELVNDADLSGIDHRIDMVFGRQATARRSRPAAAGSSVTRLAPPAGLWASDHMGVVVRLTP